MIHNICASGQKLRFYDLHGKGTKVQIVAQAQDAPSAEEFLSTHSHFRRGDIIGDNPELRICEIYMAYADMYDLMDMMESLEPKIRPDGREVKPRELVLDFQRPWKRYDMIKTLEEKLGVKFQPGDQLRTPGANKFLSDLAEKMRVYRLRNCAANLLTLFTISLE
ncbi:lysyl-tRNA synthetase [Tulasnella sp. 424]|nr:lysyl-tRNA synthetase [Tulasnella sp. 424]KAG8975503.1 lysyl-tRNA synthetase [Tulasnella sp. 425]